MNDFIEWILFLMSYILPIVFVAFIPKIKKNLSQRGKIIFNSILALYFLIILLLPLILRIFDSSLQLKNESYAFILSFIFVSFIALLIYFSIIFFKFLYLSDQKYTCYFLIIISILALISFIIYITILVGLDVLLSSLLGGGIYAGYGFSFISQILIYLSILFCPIAILAMGIYLLKKAKDNSPLHIGSSMILQIIPVALFELWLILLAIGGAFSSEAIGVEFLLAGIGLFSIISAVIGTFIMIIGIFSKNKQPIFQESNSKQEKFKQQNIEQHYSILAILALIFGIVAYPIGLILGIIALFKIRKSGQKGKGLAIAGIVIALVWAILQVARYLLA